MHEVNEAHKHCKDYGTERHASCKFVKCRRRIRCIEKYLTKEGVL